MAGGRKSKAGGPPVRPQTTMVVDNGGYTIKAGLVCGGTIAKPLVVPNCVARDRGKNVYVGTELEQCRDYSDITFRRPVEKGFIVSWEVQKAIWDHQLFSTASPTNCDPTETRLVLTEPSGNLPELQTNCDQVVFEEYGFASYYRGLGPSFNAYHDIQNLFHTPTEEPIVASAPVEVVLVVDSGYSHTTITPLLGGQPLQSGIRRLDVGGRLLTQYLARLISMRHFDMRNELHAVNEMKESACFVSADFQADLEICWPGTRGERRQTYLTGGGIFRDYVLPDFHTRAKGIVRDYDAGRQSKSRRLATTAAGHADEDVLTLRNERFTVPELLFHPSDMGDREPGLADLIQQSLQQLPMGLWPGLLANIVVVGGNSLFEGFIRRLQKEVVQRMPDECVVRVARPTDPITSTWHGAANMANHVHMDKVAVTKQEYEEIGAALVARRFAAGLNAP